MFEAIREMIATIRSRRAAANQNLVVGISIDLILWAAVGLLALSLLSTSSTTGITSTVGFLAVTFVAIMATIAVAVAFFRRVHV